MKLTRDDIRNLQYKSLSEHELEAIKGEILLGFAEHVGGLPARAFQSGEHTLVFNYFIQ